MSSIAPVYYFSPSYRLTQHYFIDSSFFRVLSGLLPLWCDISLSDTDADVDADIDSEKYLFILLEDDRCRYRWQYRKVIFIFGRQEDLLLNIHIMMMSIPKSNYLFDWKSLLARIFCRHQHIYPFFPPENFLQAFFQHSTVFSMQKISTLPPVPVLIFLILH